MSYGLKGKVKEMVTGLNALREDQEHPQNLTLRQFMAEQYKTPSGEAIQPEHLYSELKIDPSLTRVKDLYNDPDTVYLMPEIVRDGILRGLGVSQQEQAVAMQQKFNALLERLASLSPILSEAGGQRFISPEVTLDPISRGAVQAAFFRDLVMDEVMVPSPDITVPYVDVSDAALTDSDEAVTLEEGSVKYGTKKVALAKKGRLIKISYEAIWFNTLQLVQKWFLDVGRKLGSALNGMCVSTMINGDQADGSEAAAVIGVTDPAKGIQYEDITRVWVQFALINRLSTDIVGDAVMSNKYLQLPEVKNRQFPGAALLPTVVKTPLPTQQNLYPNAKAAPNQLTFQDSTMAQVQLTCVPLMVEAEKIVQKQIAVSTATIFTGFCNIQRDARVVVDGTLNINAANFPAWMQPEA